MAALQKELVVEELHHPHYNRNMQKYDASLS
jgi:hypothetical protein